MVTGSAIWTTAGDIIALPTVGQPPASASMARARHTAVGTASEMIGWGGDNGTFPYLNTGLRYDVTNDSWTATSTTNAPTGRKYHTAVWTGGEMIVWGGDDGSLPYLNTGGRYNP